MNLIGYEEALSFAEEININNIKIKVINIPAFVALKILTWGDRQGRSSKDLEDIQFVLSKYQDDERVYSELINELADEIVQYSTAHIYLLGKDIGKIFQEKTLQQINQLLDQLIVRFTIKNQLSFGDELTILKQGINST